MIFRLQYCNDSGDTAIIDIETKTGVGVQEIEGSGNPFSLKYKAEKTDKSGRFMTSSADIEIYENEFFNIDILKTSNETDIKVSYYINEVLEWEGFILPDFFSKEIKDNAVISMTATDRVSTLKSVTLDNLDESIRLRDVAKLCLDKTGLILPLLTLADFINEEGSPLFNTYIQSQRLNDEKGRSISCYDTLESILILSNAQLVQRKGAWQIINKYQLEQGVGKNYSTLSNFTNWAKTIHNFEFIGKGAIRTITPVASSVGVFQEYGGGKRYPYNYDFDEVGGWTAKNGFVYKRDNREIIEYNKIGENIVPTYGAATENYYLVNNNANNIIRPFDVIGEPYLESTKVNVPFSSSKVEINIDINAIAPKAIFIGLPFISSAAVNYAVVAESTTETLILNNSGQFVTLANGKDNFQRLNFDLGNDYEVLTKGDSIKGLLEVEGDVSDYKISVRIYGSGEILTTFVNFLSYTFKSEKEIAKGTLYKTTQGTNFTKEHDVETTVFGDYLTKGLNGYFYDYQNDDTGSLIAQGGAKTELWTAPNETESLPLLQQISRQKARQFSIAHDIVRGDIKMKSFDPLTIFKDCNNYEYVVVSATFDFLRSIANVEIEQILYDSDISRRDYIYSFFGEGESSIKSVGGISGGAGGGGGGMTSSQLEMLTNLADWWKLDEANDAIYSEKSVYSLKGVSALGLGSVGGGTGGDFDRLDAWVDYNETKANWVLSALLGYDLHTRVNSLEAGGGASNIEIATTGSGNAVTGVSKDGNTLTFAKGSTFALSTHDHAIANITGLQDALDGKEPSFTKNTAFNKNFGTVAGTVMQGNDSRIHSHSNKALLDLISQSNIDVLNLLSVVDGNIKVNTNLWATGGISALGLGEGGGGGDGGGIDKLDSWANYTTAKANFYVPASLLVPFRNDTLSRLTAIEDIEIGGRNLLMLNPIFWQRGGISSATGVLVGSTTRLANITGNEIGGAVPYVVEFYSPHNIFLFFYDENDNYLGSNGWLTERTFGVTPAGTKKVKFGVAKSDNSTIVVDDILDFKIKLEKGTIPTDWTPAPEDQITDWSETNVNSFAFLKNKPTQLSQFVDNIGVGSHIANKANPHAVTTAQIGAVDLTTNQSIGGVKSFTNKLSIKGFSAPIERDIDYNGGGWIRTILEVTNSRYTVVNNFKIEASGGIADYNWVGIGFDGNNNKIFLRKNNIGIGTNNPLYKLDVSGTGRFTGNLTASAGVNTPKVDFGNGFTIEPSGTELVFKYQNVIKQRMLSDGTILAVGGITALTTE